MALRMKLRQFRRIVPTGVDTKVRSLSTTSSLDEPHYFYAVSDTSTAKAGDHIGGKVVKSGYSTSRRGYVYGGGRLHFSCCGIKVVYGSEPPHSLEPCMRGEDGMYHPGKLIPFSYGSRRAGGGIGGGDLKWSCCGKSVLYRDPGKPPKGCTVLLEEETTENRPDDEPSNKAP